MRLLSRFLLMICLLGMLPMVAPLATAADISARKIEASYLYKFGSYVTWPEGTFATTDSPVTIGIVGDNLLADELATIVSSRLIDNRPVVVKRVERADQLAGLNIVFVANMDSLKVSEWIARVRSLPVLSVTNQADQPIVGSIINLVIDDNRIRFDVSLEAAERSRIKLSSSLMTVARKILGKRP
jgi:hypothetical protein